MIFSPAALADGATKQSGESCAIWGQISPLMFCCLYEMGTHFI